MSKPLGTKENFKLEDEFLNLENEEIEELEEDVAESKSLLNDVIINNSGSADTITQFHRDIHSKGLLTYEEEYALAKDYMETGNKESREKLIEGNYRLVEWVAKKCYSPNLPLEDLIQEGMFGLMKAVDNFNPDLGYKFSTYATWWIKQAIGRAMDNSGTIRIPVHMREKYRKFDKAKNLKLQKEGRELTDEEIEQIKRDNNISEYDYKIYNQTNSVCSMSMKIGCGDDDDTELGDVLYAKDDVEADVIDTALRESLVQAMNRVLTEKEKRVIIGRFYDNKTLEELGEVEGVTRERIRQIEFKALHKLKRSFKTRMLLKDFVEKG